LSWNRSFMWSTTVLQIRCTSTSLCFYRILKAKQNRDQETDGTLLCFYLFIDYFILSTISKFKPGFMKINLFRKFSEWEHALIYSKYWLKPESSMGIFLPYSNQLIYKLSLLYFYLSYRYNVCMISCSTSVIGSSLLNLRSIWMLFICYLKNWSVSSLLAH